MMPTAANLFVWLDSGFFLAGLFTFMIGIWVLTLRTAGADIQTLANYTARLAQKGLVEDLSGIVGNASTLVDAMNQLVNTKRGVGITLCIFGLLMMAASVYFAMVLFQVQ